MAFPHYIRYDGVEIINSARTDAYVRSLGLTFHRCEGVCETLPKALEEIGWKERGMYTTPYGDTAPWVDDAEPWGQGFAGVYHLESTNLESSMWQAQAQESLTDGGFVSSGRYTTREMRFRCLLMATNLFALQQGFNWLATILHHGDPCKESPAEATKRHHTYREFSGFWRTYKDERDLEADDDLYQAPLVVACPHTYAGLMGCTLQARNPMNTVPVDEFAECEGHRMDFFVRCPDADDVNDLYRYMLDVHCTSGPTLLSTHEVGEENQSQCPGGVWGEVEFTLVAANPFAYRRSIDISKYNSTLTYAGYLNDTGWVMYKNEPPITTDNMYEAPLVVLNSRHTYQGLNELLWRSPPVTFPVEKAKEAAPVAGPSWVDPSCPPIPQFPGAPIEALLCDPPHAGPWARKVYRAGTNLLPKYTETALLMEFRASGTDFDDVRVRLVPQEGDLDTGYHVQFYIIHIPNGATLRIDGRRRSIVMYEGEAGRTVFRVGAAEHLVTTDAISSTYRYPTLICGGIYNVVVDVPANLDANGLGVAVHAIGRDG